MPVSKSLNSYVDCRVVLDAALEAGGCRYSLASHGKAINFRQRIYSYRSLLRDQKAAQSIIPGLLPTTEYDSLEVTFDPIQDNVLIIKLVSPKGILTNLTGEPISFSSKPPEPADELDLEAKQLIAKHGG